MNGQETIMNPNIGKANCPLNYLEFYAISYLQFYSNFSVTLGVPEHTRGIFMMNDLSKDKVDPGRSDQDGGNGASKECVTTLRGGKGVNHWGFRPRWPYEIGICLF